MSELISPGQCTQASYGYCSIIIFDFQCSISASAGWWLVLGVGECGAAVECCLKINLISSNQSTGTADIFIHKLSTNFSAASQRWTACQQKYTQ